MKQHTMVNEDETCGAIIQARLGSSRLPGKVMHEIEGKPMLQWVVERINRVTQLDTIIVATTKSEEDDKIERFCHKQDYLSCYRGSEEDVLDRYYKAACKFGIDIVVRITADCPLHDPEIISKAISLYKSGDYDYVSNINPPTYPDGLDVEVFSFTMLKEIWDAADKPSEREHVTLFVRKNSDRFQIANLENNKDFSNFRWTVDEPEDLELIRAIYSRLDNEYAGINEVISLVKEKSELKNINKHIDRNEGLKDPEENKW